MYRGGLNFMRFSVSDTAEYGDYVSGPRVAEGVKATMKDVLADIQSGAFADRWIAVQEAGGAEFRELRQRDRDHQIEQVGAELRAQMPFLNPVVVQAGEAQAAASSGASASGGAATPSSSRAAG
jgi:ketol-acid reductoisomerase